MPLNGAKFYGPMTGYGSETAYYYVEVLPGEKGTTTVGGITYKEDHRDTSPGKGYNVTKEDQYPITGFTFNANVSTPIHGKYNKAKFYYTRDSYDIIFINGSDPKKTESRKYQQNISDVNYTPTKPASVPANFTFAGWYDNEPCGGTAYDFSGKTMPAQSITLYAKWQAPQVNATVYLSASADGESVTIEISYGTKLSDSEAFKKLLDEEFTEEKPSAWIDSNGALFNVDTKLYGSVTISPFFPSAKDGFTVTYVEGTNVKTDNQKYVSGSSARVLPPENSENFRAWKMEDGKLIHPGDKITVTKNITLTAVYTNKPRTETITYHYNFGDSAQIYEDRGYPKNTNATVKSLSDVGFVAPTGYEFRGWATARDSSTIEYAAGATVFVDANGDNHLYAVWQVKTYTVTWVNWNNEVLQTEPDVAYNTMPKAYTGKAPTKPSDEDHDYKFTDWDKPLHRVTGNQVYKAQYEASFNVTYDLNGGAWTTETEDTFRKFENDQVNVIEAVPTKTGYTFAGWTSKEVKAVNGKFTMPAKNVTLKAKWNVNKYTIKWVNWDGSEVRTDTEVAYGTELKAPADPTREADAEYTYTFAGWTPKIETVTGDATYKAKYTKEANSYTLTYDLDGGEWENDTTYTYTKKYNEEVEVKADPTKTGYTFAGWTSAEVEVVNGKFTMPAKNVTLTAKWNVNKYTIKWVNWDDSEVRTDTEVAYGTELEAPANPTREADAEYTYTFAGWTPKIETVTGDATYKAKYTKEANSYTLTYDLDGGEWENDTTYTYTKKYNEEVEVKADPTKTGYTFAGWTSAEVEVVNGKFTMPAKNVTLKAKWNVNKYTIKWVNWDDSEVRTDTEVAYGTKLEAPADPTREADAEYAYTFAGWTPKIETVTGDATYKAKYTKEANSYTLTYDLDGGEWENDTTYAYPKKYNEEVEVKADPTKEGYTFAGWTSAEVEVVNDKFTMPAKNVTLTAKWVANIYKVTYDLDGGEWTEATNEFPYEYKATVEVVKTVPTREGYKFSGWRSEEVTIENDTFTMPAKDVVLKAVWEANPTPTPIPSEEPTPTPAPTEEPTPTPAPSEEPTPTPAPTEEPTPTPAPTEEPTPTPAPTEEPTPTPAPTEEPTPTPAPTEEPTPTPAPTEEPTPTPAPNPNPNPNPATPTPTPVAPVVPATVATPTPKPTATPSTAPSDNGGKGDGNNDGEIGETINDNETPLANGEDIADNATPLAGLGTGAWALINLILTIVTTLLSILLLIGYIGKKKKALEDEDGNVVLDENGKEVMEYEKNKKGLWRLISIIPALIAIIVFIFTEDMTLPMIFVDKWTILHVVIALVQVVVMVLCKKKKDENDEDENAANA